MMDQNGCGGDAAEQMREYKAKRCRRSIRLRGLNIGLASGPMHFEDFCCSFSSPQVWTGYQIVTGSRFPDWKMPAISEDGSTPFGWQVHPKHRDKLVLGRNSDIGFGTYIQPQFGVEIGEDVQIGSHCAIYSVSTIDEKIGKVTIGKGARIGTHSSIMPGVTIGADARVGAYSFVTRDIPAGALAYGIPARVIRKQG
jgi:acetyltransferase-like isoleucine patch superfamily enzyme